MMKLPPQVNTVFTLLEAAGFEAFLIGGTVRDYIRESLFDYSVVDFSMLFGEDGHYLFGIRC